jgi:hypothetical protein
VTGREAMELVEREAAAAGVALPGPAATDRGVREAVIARLDETPVLVELYVAAARREIEERRPA